MKMNESLTLRGLEIPNRMWLPPMCQYSAVDGVPTDWHKVHYGARAVGGFGLVIVESTGVVPEGRISPRCLGLWNDEQRDEFTVVVDFIHSQGSRAGIQLNHAGRKSSTYPPLPGEDHGTVPLNEGGWHPVGPSPVAFPGLAVPNELDRDEIRALPDHFAAAARRAVDAGFDVIEIHAAHGYLLHQFLSPLSNQRTDSWGGSYENRTRLLKLVITAVRTAIPDNMPLFVRISATDWITDEPAWTLEQSITLASELESAGVDLVDVSTGANAPADIPVGPNYQVRFAEAIRRKAGVPTSAVGMITEPAQAEAIVAEGRADAVMIGREALRYPQWPLRAQHALHVEPEMPAQYNRAGWR